MERLWSRAWIYAGHESQIRNEGDYLTVDVAAQPLIVRASRRRLGARARSTAARTRAPSSSASRPATAARRFAALITPGPTAWTARSSTFRSRRATTARASPRRKPGAGSPRSRTSRTYRGFVFARLSPQGIGFRDYFGASLSSIDNLADRSPEGELEIAGGCLRYLHNCNWKMFVENLNDTMHPMIAHASSAGTAQQALGRQARRHAQADGDRAVRAVRLRLQVLRRHGRAGVPARPRLLGRQLLDPLLLRGARRLRGADEEGLRRGARAQDPRHRAAQHRLLPQPHDQGRDPVDPRGAAARGRQDPDRVAGPSA